MTFKLDLSQLSSAGEMEGATFNLLIYARNLKGESEKTLLENIAFNDAARRTGKKFINSHISIQKSSSTPPYFLLRVQNRS